MRRTRHGRTIAGGFVAIVALAVVLSLLLIYAGGHGGGITTVTTK